MLLASLTVGLAAPAAADPDTLAWSKMSFPKTGVDGSYFRSETISAVGPIAKGIDGSLFAYEAGLNNLFKSTDGGRTWTATKYAAAHAATPFPIVAIVPSSTNKDIVYVAEVDPGTGDSWVWKSTDVSSTTAWKQMAASTTPTNITCMDVGYKGGEPYIFVGGIDSTTFALDVLWYNETTFITGWQPLDITEGGTVFVSGVLAVAADPNFDSTSQVIAVVTDGTETWVTNLTGGVGTWTGEVELGPAGENLGPWSAGPPPSGSLWNGTGIAAVAASRICFPSDFDSSSAYELFVGVSDGFDGGDVYQVLSNISYDLDIRSGDNTDVNSLDLVGAIGSTYQLAGTTDSATGAPQTYCTTDNGDSWKASKKAPSGIGPTYVVVKSDFDTSGQAWAATTSSPTEGAGLSFTTDSAVLWNQISLINTGDTYTVNGIAFGGADRFMVTTNTVFTNNDVWKYDGTYWERVVCDDTIPAVDLVQTSPAYATDTSVFIADSTSAAIWRSTDAGGRFIGFATTPGAAITGWLVVDKNLIISSEAGTLWKTKDAGRTPWKNVSTSAVNLVSFALSPAYATDKTIIAGNATGAVYKSTNAGDLWSLVGTTLLSAVNAYVAFDPLFATNSTLYAAGGAIVERYNGTKWENIGITTATSGFALAAASGLVCSADGTLYVTDASTGTVTTVAADSFKVTGVAAARTGTITVSTGSVLVTPTGTATIGGLPVLTPTTIPSPSAAVAWTLPAATDTLTVKALANGTTGNIVQTEAAPLCTVTFTDVNGNAVFKGVIQTTIAPPITLTGTAAVDTFSLPDAEVTIPPTAGFTGMARTLAPTAPTEAKCEWENVTKGTPPNLDSLSLTSGSNILWGIDAGTTNVWAYTDTLAVSVVLLTPADKASTGRVSTASVTWNALAGADTYQIKCNTRADFNGAEVANITSDVAAASISLPNAGATYYWKVRVAKGDPILSRWSTVWSFTTGMAAAQWNPFTDGNEAPAPGATGVQLRPAFQWNPSDFATAYEFELSKAPGTTAGGFYVDALIGMTGTNALVNTVWQCDRDLDYSTTYYWHVRAISATSQSVWANGTFTTMEKPVPPAPPVQVNIPPAPAPITPAWIWAIVIIGAILVIAVIVLIVTTRRVP
jgi:hypothetical protein